MGFYSSEIDSGMNFTDEELSVFKEEVGIDLVSDFWFTNEVFNTKRWISFIKISLPAKVTTIEQALEETKKISEELYLVVKKAIDVKGQ